MKKKGRGDKMTIGMGQDTLCLESRGRAYRPLVRPPNSPEKRISIRRELAHQDECRKSPARPGPQHDGRRIAARQAADPQCPAPILSRVAIDLPAGKTE